MVFRRKCFSSGNRLSGPGQAFPVLEQAGVCCRNFFFQAWCPGIIIGAKINNHGVKYISVYSNDSYSVYIYNPSPSHAVYVGGVISFSKITHETIQVPYTAYRTEYMLSTITTHPYQNLGGILLTSGVLAGIATASFTLISRRRIKEAL